MGTNEVANIQALSSKALVLDNDPASQTRIREFCAQHRLQALRAQPGTVMNVLQSNIDLGCIMLSEHMALMPVEGQPLGQVLYSLRPDLPLFLRRDSSETLEDLPYHERKIYAAAYTLNSIERLGPVVEECIFSLVYPSSLVRGITEMTTTALQSQFINLQLQIDTPYLVRDRLIFGEIFTLIPLENDWCRGYMTLQTQESSLVRMVQAGRTHMSANDIADFRNLNAILGELTNLIWGAFKNRYGQQSQQSLIQTQVPIVVNHLQKYISFGSSYPQLCFKCTLSDPSDRSLMPLVIYQRLVFNLSWSPEAYRESESSVADLVATGELELF